MLPPCLSSKGRKKKWGLTDPVSLSPPTKIDIETSRELKTVLAGNGLYASEKENTKRQLVLGELNTLLQEWVREESLKMVKVSFELLPSLFFLFFFLRFSFLLSFLLSLSFSEGSKGIGCRSHVRVPLTLFHTAFPLNGILHKFYVHRVLQGIYIFFHLSDNTNYYMSFYRVSAKSQRASVVSGCTPLGPIVLVFIIPDRILMLVV